MNRIPWLIVALALLLDPSPGDAQEAPRVTVRVRQIAGTSLYLDVGTRHGLATGDTLQVAADSVGPPVGALLVTGSTDVRSVLTFAGDPFPVTRGDYLTLLLKRMPQELPEEVTGVPPAAREAPVLVTLPRPEPSPPPSAEPFAQRAHGRISMDMSASRSVTQVGGADPLDVTRTFATPALRFDLTVPDVVGGFTLRTSGRFAYRYSDPVPIQPAASSRVYAASLERNFTAVPLRLRLGRFYSPVEQFSGVWDGALIRVGRNGLGVGAIVGFEPDLWNQGPSTRLPKATAFLDGRARGQGWRWQGDLSAHTVHPSDSVPVHTFLGASQRISLGPLYLRHDLQMDRDPSDSQWRLSRLRARASLSVTSALELRGGLARRESYVMGRWGSPFAPRNDRIDAGLALRAGGNFLSADWSSSEDAAGHRTTGITGAFSLSRLPVPGRVGLAGSVSRWTGGYGSTLSAAPGLDLDLDAVRLRLGYRYFRSDYLERIAVGHGLDASLDARLKGGMGVTARTRVQWGGLLRSQGFDLTFFRIF
jgi:hypothetical protein